MYEHGNEDPHTSLIAGLILVIVLAAVAALSAPLEDDMHRRLLALLHPIDTPLSMHIPGGALATYDLGASAPETAVLLAGQIEVLAPDLHAALRSAISDFETATGLQPEVDLLPYLGSGIAIGVLPPEADPEGWPLPRPVIIARAKDDEAVRRFLESWLRWEAGALAPWSAGLYGATIISERVAGAELVGLEIDSVMNWPIPLPSPSVAVVDGLTIASPVRSAVVEILEHRAWKSPTSSPSVSEGSAVEIVRFNLPAWPHAWKRAEVVFELPFIQHILGDSSFVELGSAITRLIGSFGPAEGTTTVTADGDFVFHMTVQTRDEVGIGGEYSSSDQRQGTAIRGSDQGQ